MEGESGEMSIFEGMRVSKAATIGRIGGQKVIL
jgi:hypothetical protein